MRGALVCAVVAALGVLGGCGEDSVFESPSMVFEPASVAFA